MTQHSDALARSLAIYRGDPAREAALDAFYGAFIAPGALAFDVGAHVGDRTACFRRLGARVIALEPQPDCAALLRAEFRADAKVEIVEAAVSATSGRARLHRNDANPTVSTLSRDFIAAARHAPGWNDQSWTSGVDVPVVTLDQLIARYGAPNFVKIDVEGYEHEVLKGLSTPVAQLSFEFTTIQRDVAHACIDQLAQLGYGAFRASLGETLSFAQAAPITADEMRDYVASLPAEANSGDIYAQHSR
jgi:FkbM family methyltransferase